MPGHPHRPHRRERSARLGEQVAHDQRRVAHHVVQDAAALKIPAPKPRHVRPAVLFRGAREIWPAGERRAPCPHDRPPLGHRRREQLVLQVAVREPRFFHELGDALRLGDVTRERLLAGDALERPFAARHGVYDLLHVLDPGLVRPAQPQRVDRGVRHHVGDRAMRLGGAEVEPPRLRRHVLGVLAVRAPYAEHVGIAHGLQPLQVEPGVEAAAHEPDSQALVARHASRVPFPSSRQST